MSTPIKTIDLTPTWSGIINGLIMLLEDGTEAGKHDARIELRRMATILDAFNEVNWQTVLGAAETRGKQWRYCVDNDSPADCINELWDAGHNEREEMADTIEAAVKSAQQFVNRSTTS